MSGSVYASISLTEEEKREQGLRVFYPDGVLPRLYTQVVSSFLEMAMGELSLERNEHHGVFQNPRDTVVLLQAMEQDPLVGGEITGSEQMRIRWSEGIAFAKRCEYAYERGRGEIRQNGIHVPLVIQKEWLDTYAESALHIWEHFTALHAPYDYRHYFGHMVSHYEHRIWQQWYRCGLEQGVVEMKEAQRAAWSVSVAD